MIVKYGRSPKECINEYREVDSVEEGFKIVKEYLKEHDFASYYMRMNFNMEDNWVEIDFGSWTFFFYFMGLTKKDWSDLLDNNDSNDSNDTPKYEKIGTPLNNTEKYRKD